MRDLPILVFPEISLIFVPLDSGRGGISGGSSIFEIFGRPGLIGATVLSGPGTVDGSGNSGMSGTFGTGLLGVSGIFGIFGESGLSGKVGIVGTSISGSKGFGCCGEVITGAERKILASSRISQ